MPKQRPAVRFTPPPWCKEPAANIRELAAALGAGLLLALVLWAGEASAQDVCRGGAHTGSGQIDCAETGGAANVEIRPGTVNIDVNVDSGWGIRGRSRGTGNVDIDMTGAPLRRQTSAPEASARRGRQGRAT